MRGAAKRNFHWSTICLALAEFLFAEKALANSQVYIPLTLPRAEDIVAFSNGQPPATGTREFVPRARILKFLSQGRNNLNVETWYDLEYPKRRRSGFENSRDGVFTDKTGTVYFWELKTSKVLFIQTQKGEMALIQLGR